MAILYDVPSIGKEANDFGQRGPTCWYYAAKMLLKFHRKLDDKDDEIYREVKALHEVRKVMSETGKKSAQDIKAELEKIKAKWKGYAKAARFLMAKSEQEGGLSDDQQANLDFLKDVLKSENRQRITTAIEKLDEEINRDMARLNLLTSFCPNAGFHQVNKEQYDSPEKVCDLLERWGPFYTGGSVVAQKKDVKATGKTAGATPIVSVEEFKSDGAHAVVVVGASDTNVYYKDPHKTDQVRCMDLKAFHKGLHTDASDFLIAIYCMDGWDKNLAQCEHMKNSQVTVPN